MEQVIAIIEKYCTFPKIEFVKLLKLTLFNFLIGNEDMHLKNFSLITHNHKISLSPAYDLLNSTIAQKNAKEELALPLRGRKSNLTKRDLLTYFAMERLKLNQQTVDKVIQELKQALPECRALISKSFLSLAMQEQYLQFTAKQMQAIRIRVLIVDT